MIYTYVATGLAALAIGFSGAWQVQNWRHDSAQLKQTQRAAKDTFRNVERQDKAVDDYTKDKANAQVIYREIRVEVDKIVERPVYRNVCLDSDGLRELYRSLDGTDAKPSPVQPVPPSTPAR